MATRVGFLIPIRLLNSATLETPPVMQNFWPYLLYKPSYS